MILTQRFVHHRHVWHVVHETDLQQGGPGSVRLRFVHGTVRAVPVFGSGASTLQRAFLFQYCLNRKKAGSGFGARKNGSDGSDGFQFPAPVRFLSHPAKKEGRNNDQRFRM